MGPGRLGGVALALVIACTRVAAQENPSTQLDMPQVVVIGTTPLPGIGLPPEQVPANVQSLSEAQLRGSHAVSAAGALERTLGSANVNDTQGNPFQIDLNFRGFTASPVLGTPQGLSVFVDGVRANEALGDTIDWDLIPLNAIANVSVMPGSDPLFGLNTLGGAVSVTTKSGFEFPGTAVDATAGSFGRQSLALQTGGHGKALDYFLAGNVFTQRGWADHSPSRVRQLFAKSGYQTEVTDVDLSFACADNVLEGSQTLPRSWLDTPTQTYSWPDIQNNRLYGVTLKASHYLTGDRLLAAEAYYRQVTTSVFNSNVNNNFDPTRPAGAANMPAANLLNGISERRPGASLQLTDTTALRRHKNSFSLGASIDHGQVGFNQSNQAALLSPDRGTYSSLPVVLATSLDARNTYAGVYVTDSFALNPMSYWTVSARYNNARVVLSDRLGTALSGQHRYARVSPATGLTLNPTSRLTAYLAYSEGIRVPTAVELTCADPNAPCSLPNAFSSDPDLNPVISRTYEFGARGHSARVSWTLAAFDTELQDDIQFISSGAGALNAGYFRNVGRTRRLGLESGVDGEFGDWSLRVRYSYIDATFRRGLLLNSPSNSSAQALSCPTCTDIQVAAGSRIPGIPHHNARVDLQYRIGPHWEAGVQVMAQSGSFARGDENNRDVNGSVPGFAVVNLDARFRPNGHWEFSVRLDNMLDRTYSTFGQLAKNVFTAPGRSFDATASSWRPEQFRSLAPPRGAWLAIAYATGMGSASQASD